MKLRQENEELRAMVAQQAQQAQEKPKKPIGWWLAAAFAVVILAGVAVIVFRDSGEEVTLLVSAEQVLALQTACFDGGLFYDQNGACYTVDPTNLTPEDRANLRVPRRPPRRRQRRWMRLGMTRRAPVRARRHSGSPRRHSSSPRRHSGSPGRHSGSSDAWHHHHDYDCRPAHDPELGMGRPPDTLGRGGWRHT